ncbi:WD40-repeat-containing domain protein [Lasiosphaeria ovina]|uniref:WD40-repeat-containing domain protein n=1 Tax=Lasiosphaeria ovina TaxID=92902 RepID=A0AAE0N0Z2_9PEZI|nr:WD40-repeat-containing domain protein [Lasiosphaeria ovina]
MPDFKLSAQLKGHSGDVRAVSFPAANVALSASRDHTVCLWRKTADNPPAFEPTVVNRGHGFMNSLTFMRPSSKYPDGLIISGGQDPIIDVKKATANESQNAEHLLVGHGNNVCALDASPKGTWAVSGSWDGRAIIWMADTWQPTKELLHLGGDARSVWAVLAYDENIVITASADTNIRIFDLRKANNTNEVAPVRTLSTDAVVRALCKLPSGFKGHPSGADFASAGNDNIIRLWKLNGTEVGTLHGHESFIYSLASLPETAEIVSSGEDRTLRIWRGSECIQTITHPAISVWSVAVCPENGDIISGASDNVARIFSRSSERTADPDVIAHFEESVRASAIPQQQLGESINKEKLNPKSWLATHSGSKDGQVVTVKEDDGSIGAYQWSSGQQQWIHVGTVVDNTGSSGVKVPYNGKEYDYVFDVDIEEGKPTLKLPYNLAQNPYDAATKFLNDNDLPMTYIESVARFITENTKGATIGQTTEAPSDDPMGTESRYRPGKSAPTVKKALPHTVYVALTQARLEPATKRLKTVNERLGKAGHKDIILNPDGEASLDALREILTGAGTETKLGSSAANLKGFETILFVVITQWPYADRLPGLDLLRCLSVFPSAASFAHHRLGNLVSVALRSVFDTDAPVDADTTIAELVNKTDSAQLNPNVVMMSLRVVVNLFSTEQGRKLVLGEARDVLRVMGRIVGLDGQAPIGTENLNLQIALTSAAFNYACMAYNERTKALVDPGSLGQLCKILERVVSKQSDSEVLFRSLMAVGMILVAGGQPRELAKSLGVQKWISEAGKKATEARITDLAKECTAYL